MTAADSVRHRNEVSREAAGAGARVQLQRLSSRRAVRTDKLRRHSERPQTRRKVLVRDIIRARAATNPPFAVASHVQDRRKGPPARIGVSPPGRLE